MDRSALFFSGGALKLAKGPFFVKCSVQCSESVKRLILLYVWTEHVGAFKNGGVNGP